VSAECIEEQLKRFQVYDKTVDIVSCWEAVLNYSYGDEFPGFYFDRFPELQPERGSKVTPDFTTYFSTEYGLIGEIKRTFPNNKEAILNELEQIEKYDQKLGLRNRAGDYVVPDVCDIMVLIEGSSAPQIGTRLQRLINDPKTKFDSQPVLLRYQFNQDALDSRYEFQRVTELEYEFQDDHLPVKETLYNSIGEGGDYNTLSTKPKYFKSYKVQKPLCNDPPPGSYLATFLWHKIFPDYLSEGQYEKWQASSGQKQIPIPITAEELRKKVNDYMNDGTVRQNWIRTALEFLDEAELARDTKNIHEEEEKDIVIQFMGLVPELGSKQSRQEALQELNQTRELARIFIQRYCESRGDEEELDIEEEEVEKEPNTEQAGIDDFS
jgi:hypothetical protein